MSNTRDKLRALREMSDKATPGPWSHDADSELGLLGDVTIWADGSTPRGPIACQVGDGEPGQDGDRYICNMDGPAHDLGGILPMVRANAQFIAVSRTALPALVEALFFVWPTLTPEQRAIIDDALAKVEVGK